MINIIFINIKVDRTLNIFLTYTKGVILKVSQKSACDVIKMRNYPSLFRGFLSHFSEHLPHFYDVTYLIFDTLCSVSTNVPPQ